MDVITVESAAFKELRTQIEMIAKFVKAVQKAQEDAAENQDEEWVDSYEVCTFLKISARTLQRLRSSRTVNFSQIRGKTFYRISEIQRLLNENIIRRSDGHLNDLIENHKLYVKQRRNTKEDGKRS